MPWVSYQVGQPRTRVGWIVGGRESPAGALAVLQAGAAVWAGPLGSWLTDGVPLCCACREDRDAFSFGVEEPETPGADLLPPQPRETQWPSDLCACPASVPLWGKVAQFSLENYTSQSQCLW